jgi:hypothetical protein
VVQGAVAFVKFLSELHSLNGMSHASWVMSLSLRTILAITLPFGQAIAKVFHSVLLIVVLSWADGLAIFPALLCLVLASGSMCLV